jgi:hypothetical protein
MNCKINIEKDINLQKSKTLFNMIAKDISNLSTSTSLVSSKIKSWIELGLEEGSVFSTSSIYDFNNVEAKLEAYLETWKDQYVAKIAKLTEEEQASALANLEITVNHIKEAIDQGIDLFKAIVREDAITAQTNPIINDQPFVDFSNIGKLLNNSDALVNNLTAQLDRLVTSIAFINLTTNKPGQYGLVPEMEVFVKNNIGLNNNIVGFKARLWADMLKTLGLSLKENGLYVRETPTSPDWIVNKELFVQRADGSTRYSEILSKLDEKYKALKRTSVVNNDLSTVNSYIKMLLLINLDTFLNDKYSDYVGVNPDSAGTWGTPSNGFQKYTLKKSATLNATWSTNSPGEKDIENFESKLFKLVSSTISYQTLPKPGQPSIKLGSYLDTVAINAAAATINSTPLTILFGGKNIQEWYEDIANNRATFKQMLSAIIEGYNKNDNLAAVIDAVYSIQEYLYNDKSGVDLYYQTMAEPNDRINVINVESILFNQMRNVEGVPYYIGEWNDSGTSRILNPLLIDTKVGEDFHDLFSSLSVKWVTNAQAVNAHVFWTSRKFDDFIKFLEQFGGFEFSERALTAYKKSTIGHTEVFKQSTVNNMREYFGSLLRVKRDVSEHGGVNAEVSKKQTPLTEEEWVENVKTNSRFGSGSGKEKSPIAEGLDLISLFKSKHNSENFNIVSTIKNSSGDSFSILAVSNLALAFNTQIHKALKESKSSEYSHVLEASKGFVVLLEAVTKNGSKNYSELSTADNMSLGIFDLFYSNILNKKQIIVQPYNLSDKSKILAQLFDYNILTRNKTEENKFFTSEDAKDYLINIQRDYFGKISTNLISDYRKIFPKVNSIQDIDNVLSGKNWERDILPLVDAHNKNPKNKNNQLRFVEELHYSNYKDGPAFNKLLKSQIEIWTSLSATKLNEFIDFQENQFLENVGTLDLNITNIYPSINGGIVRKPHKIVEILKKSFGFTDDDFNYVYETETEKVEGENVAKVILTKEGLPIIKSAAFKLVDAEGKLSEPLKRYLWTRNMATIATTNASVKGSFLHPVKSKASFTAKDEISIADIAREENERTVVFYKRMVLLGGSINRFKQGGADGVPAEITVAYSNNPMSQSFNYSGEKQNVKVADGAVWVSPFMTQQFMDALPGTNLSRVMKPLGISIEDNSLGFLKCAFFGLNNEMVLTSMDSEYSVNELMEKMHSIPFTHNILNSLYKDSDGVVRDNKWSLYPEIKSFLEELYVKRNGEYTQISKIEYTNKPFTYTITYENGDVATTAVKNLYDLWNLFGGPSSATKVGETFKTGEESVNLVNYIIKLHALNDILEFKSAMVGMIVPREAIKSGITNTNPVDRLTVANNIPLSLSSFKTEFLGIQLDAAYDADEHTVSEVTQVLSALTENNTSPEQFTAVYNIIGQVIQKSLSDFNLKEDQLNDISKIFMKNIQRSTTVNNARAVLDNIESELTIPFSDKTVFKQFIATVISNINKEFIRNKIAGAGMVLNPSQGMIKIFEDSRGKTYLAQDLIKKFDATFTYLSNNIDILAEANPEEIARVSQLLADAQAFLKNSNVTEFNKSRAQLQFVIEHLIYEDKDKNGNVIKRTYAFGNKKLNSVTEASPLDIIQVFDGDTKVRELNLSKIDDYYEFLNEYEGTAFTFEKSYKRSRDLAPSFKNFSYITTDGTIHYKNGYSLGITRTKFTFEELLSEKKAPEELMNDVLSIPLVNGLHKFLMKVNKNYARVQNSGAEVSEKLKLLKVYMNKFVQRTWDVISTKAIFEEYDNSPDYFNRILKLENGIDTLEFGMDSTNPLVNTIPLFTYNAVDAENIVSKLYKSQFKLDGINYSDVTIDFFNNLIKKFDKQNVYKFYDVLLSNIHNQTDALQVSFKDLKTTAEYEKSITPLTWQPGVFLLNENGDLVRTEPTPNMYKVIGRRLHIAPAKHGKTYRLNHLGEKTYSVDEFQTLDSNGDKQTNVFLLDGGEGKVLAIASLDKMKTFGQYIEANSKYFGLTSIKDSSAITDEFYGSILQHSTDFVFKHYIKSRRELALKLKGATAKEARNIVDKINAGKTAYWKEVSSQMFNSWKLSNYILSARIPAQAGQSYMSMKTVGYMHESENSIYVSHWQIWLQGSDFDIDKAYVMKYDVKNGLFVGWSPYFDLRTKESTKLSLLLPAPNGATYLDGNIQADEAITQQTLDLDTVFPISEEFKMVTLENRVNVLNYVAENWDPKIHKYLKTGNPELFKTVRNHNSYYSDSGFNNFKLQKIMQVSRSAKNQISANSPVSFGDYRTVGGGIKTSDNLSLYNPYGMYKQQENNYVGKDVIGMAATGIKGYFAMIAYFSKYYDKKETNVTDPEFFINEYTVSGKTRTVTKLAGLNLKKKALDTLHATIVTALAGKTYQREDGTNFTDEEISNAVYAIDDVTDPALKLSALLSAATDNAKELLLADINAGIDFAGMHIFLIMMGFDEIDIAKFMTSDLSLNIKKYLADSFLNPKFRYGLDNALEKLTANHLNTENKAIIQQAKARLLDSNSKIITSIFSTSDLSEIYNLNRTTAHKVNLIASIDSAQNQANLLRNGLVHITNWFDNKVNELGEKKNQKTETALAKVQTQIETLLSDETVKDKTKKLEKLQQKETELLTKLESDTNQEDITALETKRDGLISSLETLAESVKYNPEYTPEELKEIEKMHANVGVESEINNFRKIYFHAKELVNLGSLLSINQGIKATLEDTYSTSRKIVNIINRQQSNVIKNIPAEYKKEFNDFLQNYKMLDIWHSLDGDKQSTLTEWATDTLKLGTFTLPAAKSLISARLSEILKVSYIMPSKFYLTEDYINKVLANVGIHNLITKGIDHNKLLTVPGYKQTVIDYLNLIKFNFNTIDILDKSPHFQAMTEAFQTGALFLGQNVLGYKFINQIIPILADIATFNTEITNFDTLNKIRLSGGKLAPVSMDNDTLDRTQDTLFELMLMD